jgi:site-specific DNA recombinase
MTRRAALYCRLSQDRTGAGVVVERQERECRELAESLGWSVLRVFIDNDVSAYRKKPRPGYRDLLAAIEGGEVDAVLAWHTDRLHRSPKELESYIDVCEPRGVVTRTVRAGELDLATASGRMVARQLGAVARYESEQTAGRTKAGKADAAARGAWSGGQRIYGYEVVPVSERAPGESSLRVLADEADVVRDASRRVLAGESLRSIARALNEAGKTTTTGKPWTGSALRKVLMRPATAGLRASAGEVLGKGQWEPLVDEDRWRGVLAVLTDATRRTTDRYARTYLGSGLYRCGVCGGPLTGNTTAGGGPGGRRAAYRCRAADRDGASHVVRDVERLDGFVIDVLVARLAQPDALAATAAPREDTAPLHEEAGALRARLDEAARGWAAGALTQSQLLAATKELRSRLEQVESQIGQAKQGNALDAILGAEDVRATWEGLNLDRRRAVLDLLAAVTVLPRKRTGRLPGGRYFDESGVDICWKTR